MDRLDTIILQWTGSTGTALRRGPPDRRTSSVRMGDEGSSDPLGVDACPRVAAHGGPVLPPQVLRQRTGRGGADRRLPRQLRPMVSGSQALAGDAPTPVAKRAAGFKLTTARQGVSPIAGKVAQVGTMG
jgi:hypothetical protein